MNLDEAKRIVPVEESEAGSELVSPVAWAYQLTFLVNKELDGGMIKKKLQELDSSVEFLVVNESKLVKE